MDKQRIDELGHDVYSYVFNMLDSELDTDGAECGRAASAAETALKDVLNKKPLSDRAKQLVDQLSLEHAGVLAEDETVELCAEALYYLAVQSGEQSQLRTRLADLVNNFENSVYKIAKRENE